jgi:hypothetical protein
MIQPAKVLGFLDVFGIPSGTWDPSLAVVMTAGLAVARACGSCSRRDANLLRLSRGTLAPHPNQQSTRAHPPRDQATHSGRRLLSGRAIGAQPCRGQAPAHRRHCMVDQTLFEHRAAEGPADERCHHRLSQCRAPLSPNQMCEKLWTLPPRAAHPESHVGLLKRSYAASDREFDFGALSTRATHSCPPVEITCQREKGFG